MSDRVQTKVLTTQYTDNTHQMHMIRFLRGNMKEISRRLPSLFEPSCRKLLTTIIQAFKKMRGEWRLNLPADLLIIALEPDWGRSDSAWRPYYFFLSGFLGTRAIQRGEAKIMAFVRKLSNNQIWLLVSLVRSFLLSKPTQKSLMCTNKKILYSCLFSISMSHRHAV